MPQGSEAGVAVDAYWRVVSAVRWVVGLLACGGKRAIKVRKSDEKRAAARMQVYGAQIGLPVGALLLGAVFNRVVGGVAALAWLGVAQFADARLCFVGCIVCTIISIAVCAWMTSVTEFYIVVLTMTTASSGSFIFGKV